MQKPQYKALESAKEEATELLAQWFVHDHYLSKCDAWVLAEEIIPKLIIVKQEAIHHTAADVWLPANRYVSRIVEDAQVWAEEMDAKHELEAILAAHQNREKCEKHGI